MVKICKECGRLLPDAEFQKEKNICWYCRRGKDLERRYGITNEQYKNLWQEQKGKCAVCGKTFDNKYLDVDHSHKNYEIRGLLCRKCNLALDETFSNLDVVKKLWRYLENGN